MLTPEQEEFWGHFKWDPGSFAHRTAKKVLAAQRTERSRLLNHAFNELMDREQDPVIVARVAKTWLSSYRLPVEPDEVCRFDEFHNRVIHILRDHTQAQKLAVY